MDFPQRGEDPMYDLAEQAVLYRDAETASATFALAEAVDLIRATLREKGNLDDLDRDRLRLLLEIADSDIPAPPDPDQPPAETV